jgi:aminoglycoside phosphotransferase (APT) family kinase protein
VAKGDAMLVETFLPELADELGLRIRAPQAGGVFGATIVEDASGQELVLKAEPGEMWAARFQRSAALSERLRARGYPAPLYVATGIHGSTSWSLQERLPGEPPAVVDERLARQLIGLAAMHAGAGDTAGAWHEEALPAMASWMGVLSQSAACAGIARELSRAVRAHADAPLRDGDVVHGDFSHRNCLAQDDRITAIIDWEQASTGDWRLDVCTLDYWARLQPERVTGAAARVIDGALDSTCPRDVRALFTAYLALRHLDFEQRLHAAAVPGLLAAIESQVAAVWRLNARAA